MTTGTKTIRDEIITVPMIAWIQFDNKISGTKLRSKFPEKRGECTPIELLTKAIQLGNLTRIKLLRSQFPLVPAFGMTIHKAQGQSYQKVTVHLSKGMSRALIYVALTRATSLQGLSIVLPSKGIGQQGSSFKSVIPMIPSPSSEAVDAEIIRLNRTALLPCFDFLLDKKSRLVYQNIQSFKTNGAAAMNDAIFSEALITVFVETWLYEYDDVFYPDKSIIRLDCTNTRGKGIVVISNPLAKLKMLSNERLGDGKSSVDIMVLEHKTTCLVIVYKQCSMTVESFVKILKRILNALQHQDVILLGDFNIDFKKYVPKIFNELMSSHGMKSLLDFQMSTTQEGTSIEAIFSNLNFKCSLYENLLSHHRPIVLEDLNHNESMV